MTSRARQNSPHIPGAKNALCIHPEPARWNALLAENRQAKDDRVVRNSDERLELLSRARAYTQRLLGTEAPDCGGAEIIGTGHQAIWHHCGIWAKVLVASRFARAVKAAHLHVVVDHDLNDTAMLMPHRTSEGCWVHRREEIEIHQRPIPLEMRASPPLERVEEFLRLVEERNAPGVCAGVWGRAGLSGNDRKPRFQTIGDVITYLHAVLNQHLGVAPELYLPVSELSAGDAFLRFAVSIAADPVRFSNLYNDAIDAQCSSEGHGPGTTRHLVVDEESDRVELPFWLIDSDGRRLPFFTGKHGDGTIRIGTADRRFGEIDSTPENRVGRLRELLEHRGCRLRPRAVTLTLFVRMVLVDWFVHGVGGARYEGIGDHLFEHYYGMRPPHLGLATCTMTLPEDDSCPHAPTAILDVNRPSRLFQHNPERCIPSQVAEKEPVAALVRLKEAAVSVATDPRMPHDRRKSAWQEIARVNRELQRHATPVTESLRHSVARGKERTDSEKVREYREYFFGLFPESRLRALSDSAGCEMSRASDGRGHPTCSSPAGPYSTGGDAVPGGADD